jgi:hypothetical protein
MVRKLNFTCVNDVEASYWSTQSQSDSYWLGGPFASQDLEKTGLPKFGLNPCCHTFYLEK